MPKGNGEDLELRLAVGFAELCPDWRLDSRAASNAELVAEGSGPVMKWVAARVVGAAPAPWTVSLLSYAERMLETRNPAAVEFVAWHLFEYLQHVTSHVDSPVTTEALRGELGPLSKWAWDRVDDFWAAVASEAESPSPISDDQYLAIDNEDLRSLVRTAFRRLPGGRWVGVTDAVQYEMRHGMRPVIGPLSGDD